MIRNDGDQVKFTWNCMIKSQDSNVFKLNWKWSVKEKKINKMWDSRSKDFLESNFHGE